MNVYDRFRLPVVIKWLRSDIALLAASWSVGLFLGSFLAPAATDPLLTLMRPEMSSRVSIVSRLITAFLPLLLAAYAVNIHKPRIVFLISFCKAFLFSFCGCLIYSAYGSAGWLVRFLFQFSDILAVPVFCWFCIRLLSSGRELNRKDLVVSLLLTLLAVCIDIIVIDPFFANLVDISLEGSLLHVGFDLRL